MLKTIQDNKNHQVVVSVLSFKNNCKVIVNKIHLFKKIISYKLVIFLSFSIRSQLFYLLQSRNY
jgi:hypothetical protein